MNRLTPGMLQELNAAGWNVQRTRYGHRLLHPEGVGVYAASGRVRGRFPRGERVLLDTEGGRGVRLRPCTVEVLGVRLTVAEHWEGSPSIASYDSTYSGHLRWGRLKGQVHP